MTVARRLRAFAFDAGGLVVLATLALYIWIAPRHIVDGDNSEFVTIGTLGGVPHPSGYPSYVLWLRLTSWLPGENGAHTTAVATAILGAATILVLHAACRAWGARPLAATFAVTMYAAAPVVMRIFTEAEVFALNGLVVATILWLSARSGPLRGPWRVAVLGVVAGLGLSNHLTCVMIAPVGILGVVRGIREASHPRSVCVLIAIIALGVGLLPYGYFLIAPETPISWRHVAGVGDLIHHFLRLDYGVGTLSPNRAPVPVIDSLKALIQMLGRTWLWGPLLAGLAMLVWRAVGRDRAPPNVGERFESRGAWSLLAASFVLAGPLLVSRFNIPPAGIGLMLCHRFHLLPAMLLAIPVAAALDFSGTWIARRFPAHTKSSHALGQALAVVTLVVLASRSLPKHSPAVERAVQNMLRPLPHGAVVIVSEDDLYFGSAYVSLVRGERSDVTVISHGQLLNPEYRGRLHERRGIVMLTPGDKMPSLRIADDVLARQQPMFVDGGLVNILSTFPSYPYGTLFRVLPRGATRPPIEEVFELNKEIYETFDLRYAAPSADDHYATHAHKRYARIWWIIARALAANGQQHDARVASEMANTLSPQRE